MKNNITAVQFIKQQIELHSDTSFFNIDWDRFDKIINKAKAIDRSQKAEEYLKGFKDGKEYQIKLDELTFKSE